MALDKNDGIFLPSIEGVVSGKTSQVTGMNGLLNDLIGNDNYLKDKKLDRGNYTGNAEKLNNGVNSAWGGEYVGDIQDSIIKEVGKHYRDRINGKGYRCIKSGGSNITTNTTEYFEPCNVVDNLDKLQNLDNTYITGRAYRVNNMIKCNSDGFRFITVDMAHTQSGYDETRFLLRFDKKSTEMEEFLSCITPLWGYCKFTYNRIDDSIICNKRTFFGIILSNV